LYRKYFQCGEIGVCITDKHEVFCNPVCYNMKQFLMIQVKNEAEEQVGRIAFLRSFFAAV